MSKGTMSVKIELVEDGGNKYVRHVSEEGGVPYMGDSMEAVDNLALKYVGPAVTRWRDEVIKPYREKKD